MKARLAIMVVLSRMGAVPKQTTVCETKSKTARGLLMRRLMLNECLSLLWAMAIAMAMVAKCECGAARGSLLVMRATSEKLCKWPSACLLGSGLTRSMTCTPENRLWTC